MEKIFPLNLTARAAAIVPGNPVTTRLEGGVGNCFPGLEFDHRNLDRRFFPGLVFAMGSSAGAPLVEVDVTDPDLSPVTFEGLSADAPPAALQTALRSALSGPDGAALRQGGWLLDSIAQGGKTITVNNLDGMTAWRLVRSLEPGPLNIVLTRAAGQPRRISLNGWRRRFVSARSGVISEAYQPGELTQSMCSPWMHDFRDCACTYWASNHPDIVLAEQALGVEPDPVIEETPIDWLRSDRAAARTAAAEGAEEGNRAAQMDHYEINERWQDLSMVLQGHENSRVFSPRDAEAANPFATTDDLAEGLVNLCKLEHTVALEYLYALYSVKDAPQVTGKNLKDAVTFVRHELLVIAVSEMRHLRWANQLIWELEHAGLTTMKFGPELGLSDKVPNEGGERDRQLRPLTPAVLKDFIAVEKPSGTLDGAYARVLATLRQPKYPEPLKQLAERILADGMQHFTRFREIERVLAPFAAGNPPLYLQTVAQASKAAGKTAVDLYKAILADLENAYQSGDIEDAARIGTAREAMFALKNEADKLAKAGKGVPYF